MKQLIILSGKGGTGKTSVAAAFAHLAAEGEPAVRAVLADADVDAANLELVLDPQPLETHEFIGGSVAVIDPALCQGCGTCYDVCRFDAVLPPTDGREAYAVDPIACEGCAACVYQCPEEAIRMVPQLAGHWFRSDSRYGPLFHAALRPAQENSGKLVTLVKQQARLPGAGRRLRRRARGRAAGHRLSRHLGCVGRRPGPDRGRADRGRHPRHGTRAGDDRALSGAGAGLHQQGRYLSCRHGADRGVLPGTDIEVVGHIPFDATVTEAMVQGQPVTAFDPLAPASQALVAVWQRIAAEISEHTA